jgi:putative aldouronate transport system substrate-binding protein
MSAKGDPDEVYLNGERARIAEYGVVPLPMMSYTEATDKELATLKTDINSYINQYIAEVATGKLNLEESWNDYVATMNAMGAERLAEIYKEAYAEATK